MRGWRSVGSAQNIGIWVPVGWFGGPGGGGSAGLAGPVARLQPGWQACGGGQTLRAESRRYRARAPIGSQAGSTIGSVPSASRSDSGSASLRAAISKTYSSNHESFIV